MISRISEKQLSILKNLAVYKFLTYDQLIRLGIDKYVSTLSSQMSDLIRIKYVEKIQQHLQQKAKFYLTKKGADYLLEDHDMEANYVSGQMTTDTQDSEHRTAIIDLHIAFSRFELLMFDRYFDKTGSAHEKSLKSKTAFPSSKGVIKPDALFKIKTESRIELYALEVERGKDKQKSYQKIHSHSSGIMEGTLNNQIDFRSGYRVLMIFEHESIMQTTLDMVKDFTLKEYFLFKSLDQTDDLETGWINLKKEPRRLFYL